MVTLADFPVLQQRKRRSLALALGGFLLLIIFLLLRFVPSLNDRLSGPPRYIQAIANAMGRQIAATVHGEYPVLVVNDENAQCRSVHQTSAPDYDDGYYVLSYAEKARALCFTMFAEVPYGSNSPDAIILNPTIGHNYGRGFTAAARVVPLHRNLTVLSPAYLALLHWRTEVDRSIEMKAGTSQRLTSPSAQLSFANVSLSLFDIRAEVASRHVFVNRVMLGIALIATGMILFSLLRVKSAYRACQECSHSLEFKLTLKEFLAVDLAAIAASVRDSYQQRREEFLATTRLENMLRREKEEARRRLQGLMDSVRDEQQRLRIQEALHSDDSERVRVLLDELQPQVAQKKPEERLRLLLESLKEYCTEDELKECEKQAFHALRAEGFREARDIVIESHDRFRTRAKQSMEENDAAQNHAARAPEF